MQKRTKLYDNRVRNFLSKYYERMREKDTIISFCAWFLKEIPNMTLSLTHCVIRSPLVYICSRYVVSGRKHQFSLFFRFISIILDGMNLQNATQLMWILLNVLFSVLGLMLFLKNTGLKYTTISEWLKDCGF